MNRPPGPEFASAAAVAGLARELEGVRRSVAPVAGLAGRVDELARMVAQLAETVSALTARPAAVVAPSWLMLPGGPEAARQVLEDLAGWVGAVYLRYPNTTGRGLPECWCWHPEVVEELLWLRHAWLAAYQGGSATVSAAGDWHERLRPGVARRISQMSLICLPEWHLSDDGVPVPDQAPAVPAADVVALAAQWWGAHGAGGSAPAPEEPSRASGEGRDR